MQELATLQARFEENVLDCMNAWSRTYQDAEDLAGLPPHVLERARETARARGVEGWVLTLDQPNYVAVITHAEKRRATARILRSVADARSARTPPRRPL